MVGSKRNLGIGDPDARLMLAVKAGDREAFVKLFESYAPRLVGYVDRYLQNRAVSEEIVQEVFLKLYRTRKRYTVQSRFSTWLYRIATNTALNAVRRRQHQKNREPFDEAMVGTDTAGQSADRIVDGRRLEKLIYRTIDALPPNQRAAFNLTRFAGCTYLETADVLGLSESAIKSLVFRAADTLRQAIDVDERRGASRSNTLRLVKR